MVKIYWTTIFASASVGAWLLYLLWGWKVIAANEKFFIALFLLNLFILILIREKSY